MKLNSKIMLDKSIDILLVDDRAENLLALEVVLESVHYNLIKKNSGDEALRYLLDHEPAVILMDVQMPNMDGFETASIIKKSERTREIPIIFITAISKEEKYIHKGYEYGAVDYISKPFDPSILSSKVKIFADLARKTKRLLAAEKQLRENEIKDRERQIAQLELKDLKREHAVQKKYRELVDGIDHGIVWAAHLDSLAITFVSSSAEKILGHSLESWAREPDFLLKHIHPEDLNKFTEIIQQLRLNNDDQSIGLEHRYLNAAGKAVWLHTGIRLSLNDERQEIRGLSVDITKIKEAEEILRRSKGQSDFLAKASLILSESLESSEVLKRLGKQATKSLASWFRVDLIDESGNAQLHAEMPRHQVDDPEELRRKFQQAVKSGKTKVMQERADAAAIFISPLIARGRTLGVLYFRSVVNSHGTNEVDLSTVEDLAHRISLSLDNANLYRQAQSSIKAREEFLSIASHELKTPLTPLKIQIQMLMKFWKTEFQASAPIDNAPAKTERIMKLLQSSDRQLVKLTKLIDNLLDISRINAGKLLLNCEEFDLVELMQEMIERFGEQLQAAKCEVTFTHERPYPVFWDRFRIEQVLINLLTNAIKYGPGKPIRIGLQDCGNMVKISFEDQGVGIAKENQERVFERFERVHDDNHNQGLGLGLYIVSQVLHSHGGRIDLKSDLGKGSCFMVELPIKCERTEALHPPVQ